MLVITVLLVVFIFTFKSLASYIKKIRTGDPNESDITYWMFSYDFKDEKDFKVEIKWTNGSIETFDIDELNKTYEFRQKL